MPHWLEIGVTQRLVAQHLNGDRATMGATLQRFRDAPSPQAWVEGALPDLWSDPGFTTRRSSAEHMLRDWFGMVQDPETGHWSHPPAPDPTGTGFWIGYHGDVERIVRKAFVWALELALGLEPGADPATRADAGPPDAIELLWSCACPWFEAWVVRRPADMRPLAGEPPPTAEPGRGQGLVTICFLTPPHRGASVSETPLATAPAALTDPDGNPLLHPVPSLEIDYEELGVPWAHGDVMAGARPRVPAARRRYATWIVSHGNHVLTDPTTLAVNGQTPGPSDTTPSELGHWSIPSLSTYHGTDDVVVVSPSLRAGGVTHDGRVVPEDATAYAAVEKA